MTTTEDRGEWGLAWPPSGHIVPENLVKYVVYFVESAGRYKIGVSKHFRRRFKALWNGSPHEVHLVYAIECRDAAEMSETESYLLGVLKEKARHGEWHELTFHEAIEVIELMQGMDSHCDNSCSLSRLSVKHITEMTVDDF